MRSQGFLNKSSGVGLIPCYSCVAVLCPFSLQAHTDMPWAACSHMMVADFKLDGLTDSR